VTERRFRLVGAETSDMSIDVPPGSETYRVADILIVRVPALSYAYEGLAAHLGEAHGAHVIIVDEGVEVLRMEEIT